MSGKIKSNLSVIITTRWASKYLKLCLESIRKNASMDNEIIVVADYPSWQTLKYIQDNDVPYVLTAFAHNFMAWNEGARHATRDYIVIVADDVVFGPGWDTALSELARPEIVGCLTQYTPDAGYPFGYQPGNIDSFNMEEFTEFGVKNAQNMIIEGGICWPLMFNKDVFFQNGGFTYHTGRGHGHDIQLVYKILTSDSRARQLKSQKSFIFHFGPTGNQDRVGTSYIPEDFSAGLLVCARCETMKKGFGSDETCDEVLDIVKKGYWVCDNCKKEGK